MSTKPSPLPLLPPHPERPTDGQYFSLLPVAEARALCARYGHLVPELDLIVGKNTTKTSTKRAQRVLEQLLPQQRTAVVSMGWLRKVVGTQPPAPKKPKLQQQKEEPVQAIPATAIDGKANPHSSTTAATAATTTSSSSSASSSHSSSSSSPFSASSPIHTEASPSSRTTPRDPTTHSSSRHSHSHSRTSSSRPSSSSSSRTRRHHGRSSKRLRSSDDHSALSHSDSAEGSVRRIASSYSSSLHSHRLPDPPHPLPSTSDVDDDEERFLHHVRHFARAMRRRRERQSGELQRRSALLEEEMAKVEGQRVALLEAQKDTDILRTTLYRATTNINDEIKRRWLDDPEVKRGLREEVRKEVQAEHQREVELLESRLSQATAIIARLQTKQPQVALLTMSPQSHPLSVPSKEASAAAAVAAAAESIDFTSVHDMNMQPVHV